MTEPARVVAAVLAVVFAALALLHVGWAALGGRRGWSAGAVVPARADGAPVFRPGRGATLAVAAALAAAGVVVLGRAGLAPAALGARGLAPWYRAGPWALAAVLALRAVGDFRYVGLFKRQRGTRFAALDTRVYTPLCAALAAGVCYLAAG